MIAPLALLCSLIALVAADYAIDARINQTYGSFMDKFEPYLEKVSYQVVTDLYNSSSNDLALSASDAYELSSNMTGALMTRFRPIAYQIIYDAGYNTQGKYYIYDNSTKQWHLPNKTAPVHPVDGATVNAQIITKELDNAFRDLLGTYEHASALSKRSFFGGVVSDDVRIYLKTIKFNPSQDIIDKLNHFKGLQSWNEHEMKVIDAEIEKATKLIANRKDASKAITDFIEKTEESPLFKKRISDFEEKLKEVENAKKTSTDPNEIANLSKDEIVLKQELKRAKGLYWKEAAFFNRVFRSRLSKIVGSFLL